MDVLSRRIIVHHLWKLEKIGVKDMAHTKVGILEANKKRLKYLKLNLRI